MPYEKFLESSPRLISTLNRMNQNYEKRLLLEVVNIVLQDKDNENEEVIYADNLSIFF